MTVVPTDHVATILRQWGKERPDLDHSPVAVVGRLARLALLFERRLEENFKRHGLQGAMYDVLATLRRNGEPFCLTPTQLQAEMMLSSGATTHRIDLLEERGLVRRTADPSDRRGTLVRLTPEGKALVDEVVETHLETERALLAGLSATQRRELSKLLEVLAQSQGL
jgi:DNA-binding MarR family transcriptional regulator